MCRTCRDSWVVFRVPWVDNPRRYSHWCRLNILHGLLLHCRRYLHEATVMISLKSVPMLPRRTSCEDKDAVPPMQRPHDHAKQKGNASETPRQEQKRLFYVLEKVTSRQTNNH